MNILRDAPPVDAQPLVQLTHWAAVLLYSPAFGAPQVHLAGMREAGALARVTSPVVRLITRERSVVTSTGRVYQLYGEAGLAGTAPLTLLLWCARWDAVLIADASPLFEELFDEACRDE